MSQPSGVPPPIPVATPAASPERTLRRLYLTLFLRGRTSRGLRKERVPKSVGSRLAMTLLLYALVGCVAVTFRQQPMFALSLYLHGMTLVFLGMFVAASAGEVLFNQEEGEILLHRPVTARSLLRAKVAVLVEVALWLAGAFNLAGLFVGAVAREGSWLFPFVHAFSTSLAALLCTSLVVLVYQLCLRWFGRERLEALMTTTQVLVVVAVVAGGQVVPHLLARFGGDMSVDWNSWWLVLLPPAWFAGLDAALVGRGTGSSWTLAAVGVAVTGAVMWLALGRLARDYETGLQSLSETRSARRRRRQGGRRWLDVMLEAAPLRWWLRDPVARASFRLVAAYLVRDRDVKLRLYPGLAPMLLMPVIFLIREQGEPGRDGGFGIVFAGAYLGLIPVLGLQLLNFSQHWQAADVFRLAPVPGPAALCHGARRAVLCLLTMPMLALLGLLAWFVRHNDSSMVLLLPGIIALPVCALVPCFGGKAVPLSSPTEEAKSVGRALPMIGVTLFSAILAVVANAAWLGGWFKWMLAGEFVLVTGLYWMLRASLAGARWASLE